MNHETHTNHQSLEVAQAAALILIDGLADSFLDAKKKAALSCGVTTKKHYPTNIELLRALAKNLKLLEGDRWLSRIRRLRCETLVGMRFLQDFEPHLVGSVLYGTATADSQIVLHLYSDEFEKLTRLLADRKIRFELFDTTLRVGGGEKSSFPSVLVTMNGNEFVLVVMPLRFRVHPPQSPLDGKPYTRLNVNQLRDVIDRDVVFVSKYLDHVLADVEV